MHRSWTPAGRRVGGIALAFWCTLTLLPGPIALADDTPGPPPLTDLDSLFTPELTTWLGMSLNDFCPEGPSPSFLARFTKIEQTGHGCTFEAYDSSVDPFGDPGAPTTVVSSRTTLEVYVPASIDFGDLTNNWILLWKTPKAIAGEPEPEGTAKRRIFARKAAERGITVCLWFDHDRHPKGGGAETETVPVQLGSTEGGLATDGLDWMMRKDPAVTPLDRDDFTRLWRHYGLAQQNILAMTFCQRLIEDTFGPPAQSWIDGVKFMIADGSKGVGGVIAAAGVDPRVKAVRFSGAQELNADPTCAQRRYETDWGECAAGQHRRAEFAEWSYDNRNNTPSFFDLHIAGHDPDRYQDKLWLDVVGTADWSTPQSSHYTWWDARDGLIGGVPDAGEDRWNYRIVRRPNANHGVSYSVGFFRNFEVLATDLLLWRTMRHLVLGGDLPRVDMVSVDTSNPAEWTARVRVTDAVGASGEEFYAWVMLSDDPDTRRCSAPIENVPNGNCFDGVPGFDDNKEEEDKFIRIAVSSVTLDGEFRTLAFTPPPEIAAFTPDPMISVFVELVSLGPSNNTLVEDTWVHTEVIQKNRGQYADQSCP